jgi:hypothetical protein
MEGLHGAEEAGEEAADAASSLRVGTADIHGSEEIVLVMTAACASLACVVVDD